MSTPETDLLFEKFLQDKGYVSVQGARLTGVDVGSAGPGGPKFPIPQVKMSGINLGDELDNQFDSFIQGKGWPIRDELTEFDKAQEIVRRRDATTAKAAEATAKAQLPSLVQKEFSSMTSEEDRPFMPRLKQVGTQTDPKTGAQIPILKFRPPTPEEKSAIRQIWDEIQWRRESPEGILQSINDRMSALTLGSVSLDKMVAWAEGKPSKPYEEQEAASRLQAEQKTLGYIPWTGKVIASSFENLLYGGLAYGVMGGAGAAAGRAILGGAKVAPIISRVVIPSIFQGTITGLATKPEEDSLDARLKSIPLQVLYWAAFNTVGLGIEKLTDLINWNVQYRNRIAGTGPRGGFEAGQGINVEPEFAAGAKPQAKTSFTQAEIRDIYNKQGSLESDFLRRTGLSEHDFRLKMSQDPRGTLEAMGLSKMEAEVYASISDASLWKEARLRGWIPDNPIEVGAEPIGYRVTRTGAVSPSSQVAGETAVEIPVKPSWGDVFRKTPAGYPTPGIVGNAPGEMPPVTPQGVVGGQATPGPAPRMGEAPIVVQNAPQASGLAKTGTSEAPPIPAGAEERDWGIKNQAKRGIIDKAISGTADPYEMDLARGFLEDPKLEGVGNALLSNIVERVKNPPYTIRFDVRDMKGLNTKYGHDKVDELILKPIQDELADHNTGNNPLDWKTMRIGGDEFQGYGYDTKEAEDIGRGVYRRLQSVKLPDGEKIYLDYGIGTTPEEADKNLFLFKNANKAPGAVVDEATKSFSETTTEPIAVKHWTKPENVDQIYEKGFNTKLPPVHGTGGFKRAGYKSSDKFGRGVLYFSADDARWNTAHEHVGEGNGDVNNVAWDNQDQKYVTEVKALKTLNLSPIEANIKPGTKMLVIDSLQKYLDVQKKLLKRAYIKDEMPTFVKAVKKAGYDALRVKDNPGQWNRPNTNESVYGDATGRGGKDDFFIFNRDVLEIPEQGKFRARKIFKGRILAQQKRGRVGLPKNAPKLWKDIMAITGGTGIKPWMNDVGRPREKWKLIPQVLKNKGGFGYDEVQDALEKDYGYKFDNEDLFSLLQQSDKDWSAGQGSDVVDQEARAEAEAADRSQADYEHLQEEINRLKNPGESDDSFWGRMTKEASESGFGDDVYGYADSQMKLYRAPGEAQFGAETAFRVRRSVEPLPPQQKIPETGTFAAVRTDDGGIYFGGMVGTHYELIHKLGLPPERVVGGGFIQDGQYIESPRSDARRIGMNARADLGMQEPVSAIRPAPPGINPLIDTLLGGEKSVPAEIARDQAGDPPGASGAIGDYKPGEKTRVMKLSGDWVRCWNMAAKNKYGGAALGDKGVQEAMQNAVDAVIMAGKRIDGKITILTSPGGFTVRDNGIGMSEDDIADVFLSIFATGKSKAGMIGNFGIGKAVILGPHEEAKWTLRTRDNYVDSEIVQGEKKAQTIPMQEGTVIEVNWPDVNAPGQFHTDVITPKAKMTVQLSEFGDIKMEVNGEPHAWILANLKNKDFGLEEVNPHVKYQIRYYPIPELEKLNVGHENEPFYSQPGKRVDRKIILRIQHPSDPKVMLMQDLQDVYDEGFSGALLVDIMTDLSPEDNGYPLTDSRQALKYGEMRAPIDKITQQLAQESASSKRLTLNAKPTYIDEMDEWKPVLKELKTNPRYKGLIKTINGVYEELGLPDEDPLNLEVMVVDIDEGYEGARVASVGNALQLIAYDAVLRVMSNASAIPYGTMKGLLSKPISGEVVESNYNRTTGNLGLNYTLVDLTAVKNPGTLAMNLRDLAAHELNHYHWARHNEAFTSGITAVYDKTNERMEHIYKIAYAALGFEYQPRDLVSIATKNGRRMVPKNLVKIYGQKQLALNLESSEDNDGGTSLYTKPGEGGPREVNSIRRTRQEGRGLSEEPVGAGGGPGGNRPGQHGETGGLGNRGLLEQPRPSGHGAALPGGVGVQPEPGGLTPPEEKPTPFKPAEPYTPREGEAQAQGVLPMPDAGPLFSAHEGIPPQQQLVNDVYRLTSGDNFPRHWASDTPEQIQDNRQNLALYSMEHYKPSAGTLEHYVNNIKKFFKGGEMPTGQETSESLRRKLEGSMPTAVGKEGTLMEAEFPTTASAFGEETGPKNKPPAEPEYIDQGMPREKAFEEEEVQILNLFRNTAKGAAPHDPAMEARYLDVMKSRLLPTLPESFSSIGNRLGISKAQAIADYQKLFGILKDSDVVKEMIKRHMRTANLGPIPNEEDLRRLGLWIRKYFSTTRGATVEIDRQNDERLGSRMAEIFDQTLDSHVLKKFVDSQPSGVDDYLVKLMRGEITGNGYNDIANSALPTDIKDVMLRVRRRIDSLSELIIAHGGLSDQTKAAFERNLSKYLSRSYRLYQDKHWNPTPAQRAGFSGWLQRTYTMTPEEADTYIEAELAKGRNNQGIQGSRSKRIPQGNFRHLQQLSPEWKEFAGEIDRVPWLTMHTITHQATEATNAKFLTWMSGHLPDLWTGDFAEAAKRGWQNSQIPDSQAWGALRGKWVSPELKQYIDREVNYTKSDMEEAIQKFITNPFKWTKTIGSWPTHMRNFLGNTMFSPLIGNSITNPLNWKYYKKSLDVHLQKNALMRDAWKDLIRHGVTETQFYGSEIPRMHQDVMNFDDPGWYDKVWDKMVKLPMDKMGEGYNFEDSWYRVAAFYNLTDPRGKNMTPEQAVGEINAGLQNYRKLPLVVDWLRRWPVLGPFISFKYNTMVIVGKQARKGYEETRNPATRAKGYGRLIRLGLILALPSILSEVSKRYFNVDEDKIRELESYYPQYRRNGTFLYFRNFEGKLKVFDMSYINPFGDLERYLNATIGRALRGDRVDIVGLQDAMDFFSLPLLDAWQIIIKGQDPTFGTKYNSLVDRAKALVAYLYLPASMPIPSFQGLMKGEKFGPATIEATDEKGRIVRKPNPEGGNLRPGFLTGPQFKAIIDAYNGNPDKYGRVKHLGEEIKSFFTGIRTWDVDPAKLLAQAIVQKRSELSDAQNELKTWMTRNSTAPDWELQQHIKTMNNTIVGINKEVEKIMKLSSLLEKDGFTATKDRW